MLPMYAEGGFPIDAYTLREELRQDGRNPGNGPVEAKVVVPGIQDGNLSGDIYHAHSRRGLLGVSWPALVEVDMRGTSH